MITAKKNIAPPKLATHLLHSFLRNDLAEDVEGDLEEKFYSDLKSKSVFKTKSNYWFQVIHYLRPFALKKFKSHKTYYFMMYSNYFKTAFRNTIRNKVYSSLNISGLSIGMAVTILIGLWMWDELSFNKEGREDYSSIARIIQNVSNNGEVQTWMQIPYPLAEEIRKNHDQDFDYVTMMTGSYDHLLSIEDKKFTREGCFMESNGPHLFTLPMISGTRDALKDMNAVLISQSLATALYGDLDPINKTFSIDDEMEVKIAGVYKDFPSNSSFKGLDFIATWELFASEGSWIKSMSDPWRPNAFELYVKINEHTTFEIASAKIKDEKLKHLNAELIKKKPELFLWPMSQWHLYSEFKEGRNIGGRIQYVWMFGIIGGFVLLLACINFMNLCTARSEKRAKEIGIRKSIGSVRLQLIQQFFSESFLMVFISLGFAMLVVWLSIPFFNEMASKNIELPWSNAFFWIACFSFCLLTALIAGSYPALYLSSFQAVNVLKGTFRAAGGTTLFRRGLVVVQFSVSVTLIIGTLVVFQQIQYAKNRPMGYNSNGLITVPLMNGSIHKQYDAVQNELLGSGKIVSMAESSAAPTSTSYSSSGFVWEGKDPNLSVDFRVHDVSHTYGKTIGWEIAEGRDYSKEFLSDSLGLIINEAALQFMQLKDPIGATIQWSGNQYHIVGIVRDMIAGSPYEPVPPTIYDLDPSGGNMLTLKINEAVSASDAVAKVEEVFKKFNPEQPFEYYFVDELYGRKFGNEERVGKLATVFTGLAIFISCLGIFGLAAFVAEQRTKEIGIRKVLGASMLNVWQLISREFILLVVLSCVIAIPIGYYLLKSWLAGFSYRTEISLWVFAISFLGALLITLLTVSTQAIKAAMSNPVKSLRSE